MDPVTGLAGRIYTAWRTNPAAGFSNPLAPAQRAMVAAQCEAIAQAIVAEITANGQAVIPADASGDGLQNGTTHPTSEKTLGLR